jgi:hypothetical protein
MTAELITIRWREIPAQVTAREGRRKVSIQLSERFQIAIDRASVRAGRETTDEYLAEWNRTTAACGPDLAVEAEREAERLETAFTPDVLSAYVRAGGVMTPTESEDS